MGCGKTVMALETARRVGVKRVLVFGPKFLSLVWRDEAEEFGIDVEYIPYSQVHKVKPESLTHQKFWILEEAHAIKSPTTRRTKAVVNLLKRNLPERLILLTGTPIKNRVPDIWTLIGMVSLNPFKTSGLPLPEECRRFQSFCRYFCVTERKTFGGRSFEKFLGLKPSRLTEFKDLLAGKMIRFKARDVLTDLPDLVEKGVRVNVGETPGLETEYLRYVNGQKTDSTAKSLSALLKAATTAEYVKNILEEEGGPVLVFTDHINSATQIATSIAGKVALITGATPAEKRQECVRHFQEGRLKVIVATIGSFSTGVTLHAARHVVFNDLSWVPSDNLQAVKRIHRIGQKATAMAHYMIGSKTDAHIVKTLRQKMRDIGEALS